MDDVLRAAKLSRVPGVTIAEACARFGVRKPAVSRARKDAASQPTLAELALAALTKNGEATAGAVEAFAGVASWISYLDKSEYSAAEVRTLLAPFVDAGQLVIEGDRWTLARPWP